MRPDELFGLDEADYRQRVSQHTTKHLRQQERTKCRRIDEAAVEVTIGVGHTIANGGLTAAHPIYAYQEGNVAEQKLGIIQAELRKRGVKLYDPNSNDTAGALAAVMDDEVVGDDAAELEGDDAPDDDTVAGAVESQIQSEVIGNHVDALTSNNEAPAGSKPVAGRCTRQNMVKHKPLQCNFCQRVFDTSHTEFIRRSPFLSLAMK